MLTVYRYRQMKPRDGKIEFVYHRDGTVLGFTENWTKMDGWEVCLDVLVDTGQPVERRKFFLCTGGDDLTLLGDSAFAYHVGTNTQKGYASYLFDVTHLPDQLYSKLEASWERLNRGDPSKEDLSYKQKHLASKHSKPDRPRKTPAQIHAEREENARRRQERLAHASEFSQQLVETREAADRERLRLVGDGES
jgi:hypothetical protein